MSIIDRPAVSVHGTLLEVTIRAHLRSRQYAPVLIGEALAHIETNSTVVGYGGLEADDVEAVESLVIHYTANVEHESADSWPSWTDRDVWETTDPIEPDDEDREWAAAEFAAVESLSEGLVPQDFRPVKVRPGDPGTVEHYRQLAAKCQLDLLLGETGRHSDADVAAVGAV